MIKLILAILVALFPISEIALAVVKRSREQDAHSEDRGSWRLLWIAIAVGVSLAIAVQLVPATRLPGSPAVWQMIALACLMSGLALRWVAIVTLGRFFTVDVAVHKNQEVIQSGLYQFVRHPSYTGLLLAFVGLGVFFGNWLSIMLLLIPVGLAVVNRVSKEERALLLAFGPEYANYCARTKRFIPGLV